jgi:hypothetical protein
MDLSEDDEDLDEGEESKGPVSIVDKIKKLLAKKKPAKKAAATSDKDKKGEKKSIISKPIAAILLLGVVAFLFGDQILPTEPETPAVDPELAAFEAKKLKKAEEKKAAEEAAAAGGANGTEVVATDPAISTEPVVDPVIPGETPTTDTTTETPPVDTTTTIPDLTPTEPTEPVVTETPTTDPVVTDPVVTEPTTENPPIDTATVDTIDPDTTAQTPDENMTDKILEDLEKQVKESTPRPAVTTYTAPPDYEYRGRGLVYNCVGKHWACIDGPSYRVCEDNSSSTKFLKRRNECYPFNVYQTQNGCEKTQNRMVSSGAKTNFCNE